MTARPITWAEITMRMTRRARELAWALEYRDWHLALTLTAAQLRDHVALARWIAAEQGKR